MQAAKTGRELSLEAECKSLELTVEKLLELSGKITELTDEPHASEIKRCLSAIEISYQEEKEHRRRLLGFA